MDSKYLNIVKSWNHFYFLLAILFATYLVLIPQILLTYLFPSLEVGPNTAILDKGWAEKIILGVVFVPAFETFFFQYIPHTILSRGIGLNWKWVSAISAIIFGVSHWYGFGYIMFATSVGFILIFSYILLFDLGKNPFVLVMIAHMIRNLTSFGIHYFFIE